MKESDIERYLVECVEAHGGETRKVVWMGRTGAPDRLVMLGGRSQFVELKSPAGKLRKSQVREHAKMKELGGIEVVVINSLKGVHELVDAMRQPEEWERFREYCS